jgi:uncharacterized protein YydD (DUF2326 family)
MIISLSSSIPTFKALTFGPGLNILLADLTNLSTDKQTRNSAGKTSVIEILHFLLGSDANSKSLFKKPEILQHSFTAVFRFGEADLAVTRSCSDEKKIYVDAAAAKAIGVAPARDDTNGRHFVSVEDWKAFLGEAWFKVPADRKNSPFVESFTPTFRALIGYFARRRRSGGYNVIQKQNEFQQPWDWQVNLSYLIGLDWKVPREIQELAARTKGLKILRTAIKEGELGSMFGTSAEIRPELVRTEERLEKLRSRIASFEVLDTYRETAAQVAFLKAKMGLITVDLALLGETIQHLERAVSDEKPPPYASVEKLYSEAGVQLPGISVRRFDDVQKFQESVVANRRKYLEEELAGARARHTALLGDLGAADSESAALLRMLEGKGAFEDLKVLNADFATLQSRADVLRDKLKNASLLENQVLQGKRESAELEIRLQEDHKAEEASINAATARVDRAIAELYDDRKGNLIIGTSKNGPKIEISIQGDGNLGGIDQMKIFCFDCMLFETATERLGGPHFLLHDSHLFDGVDKRQVYLAMLFGAKMAENLAGQYVITMNSDEFEASLVAGGATARAPDRTMVEAAVMPVRLTDDENGGLFGFRFD